MYKCYDYTIDPLNTLKQLGDNNQAFNYSSGQFMFDDTLDGLCLSVVSPPMCEVTPRLCTSEHVPPGPPPLPLPAFAEFLDRVCVRVRPRHDSSSAINANPIDNNSHINVVPKHRSYSYTI